MGKVQSIFQGMDLDNDDRSVAAGYTRANFNCILFNPENKFLGTVTNVRGNKMINNSLLPSGDNICQGAFEDKQNNRIFYVVYNSNGNHSIFQYNIDGNTIDLIAQGSVLGIDLTRTIEDINIINNILKWVDSPNPPYEIDVARANNTGKLISFNLYFGDPSGTSPFFDTAQFHFTLIRTGFSNINSTFALAFNYNFDDGLAEVETVIQSVITANGNHYDLTNNGSYLTITEKVAGVFAATFTSSNSTGWLVFTNTYLGNTLNQMYLDVIKYPPHHPIIPILKNDLTIDANYIKEHVFQFRYRYIFNEKQKSAWAPWSIIPLDPNLIGTDLLKTPNNYVELDYSDKGLLFTDSYRQMIQKVELSFRESNTGLEYSVVILEQYQLSGKYNFFNNESVSAVDAVSATKLYDEVPIDSLGLVFGDNREFYANNLEGYDEVNLDTSLDLSFSEFNQPKTWIIKGITKIYNLNRSNPAFILNAGTGAVIPDGTTTIGDYVFADDSQGNRVPLAQAMFQHIRMAGFIHYLTGTDYYGISKHYFNGGNPYNAWEIDGVPGGTYTLRIASHLTDIDGTYGENYQLYGPNRIWQKTSTTAEAVAGHNGAGSSIGIYELTITLDANGGVFDLSQALPNGVSAFVSNKAYFPTDILPDLGDGHGACRIVDLTNEVPGVTGQSAIMGYLVHDLSSSSINDKTHMATANRIEGQHVLLTTEANNGTENVTAPIWPDTYTDHNGFFFFGGKRDAVGADTWWTLKVQTFGGNFIKEDTDAFYTGDITNAPSLGDSTLRVNPILPGTPTPRQKQMANDIAAFSVPFAVNPSAHLEKLMTKIWGKVTNSLGTPLAGIQVYYTRSGENVVTTADGKFSIWCYMLTVLNETAYSRNLDFVVINNEATLTQPIHISPFEDFAQPGKQYSKTVVFFAQPGSFDDFHPNTNPNPATTNYHNFRIDLLDIALSAEKRGTTVEDGIIYYDRGNRSTAVCFSSSLLLKIPPLTQDLNLYDPVKYPISPTYKYGPPIISWEINNIPPDWATHWAWCRRKNNFNFLLQVAISSASYLTSYSGTANQTPFDNRTIYGNPLTTVVFLDLSTLTYYNQYNPGSTLAYTFTIGDRLRILTDGSSNYYTSFWDVEIKGQAGSQIYIDYNNSMPELMQGSLIEIYSPRISSANNGDNFFYEIGEFYDIVLDVNGNRVHQGQIQNQIIGVGEQPATGTFTSGESYFRLRKMPTIDKSTGGSIFKIYSYYVEDFSISDFVSSKSFNIGRPNVINKDFGQARRYDNIRFSDPSISRASETKTAEIASIINGSSSFQVLNNKDSATNFGAITKIIVRGLDLFIIQTSGCVSAYLNVNAVKDQADTNLISISDSVINTMRPTLHRWGCVDRGSIVENKGRVYYFCREFGIFVRYSQNGHTDINDKISSHAYKISGDLLSGRATEIRWISCFDEYYGNYTVCVSYSLDGSFVHYNMSFNEDENKWTTFWDFLPEQVCGAGAIYVAFNNGLLYNMYDPTVPCNTFFGVFYKQKFTPVFSDFPESIKTFKNIILMSNKKWSIPVITTPPNEFSASGQETEVLDSDFNVTEGVQSAIIMRDKNTPNIIAPQIPIISGDPMRGYSITLNMENSETDDVSLRSVDVNYNESKYIPK